jgi:hypothetical protein
MSSYGCGCNEPYLNQIDYIPQPGEDVVNRRFRCVDDVVSLMTVGFLFTPTKIIFEQERWNLFVPYRPIIPPTLYNAPSGCGPNACVNGLSSVNIINTEENIPEADFILRSRRLYLPPLNVRYRDLDMVATESVLASEGNINAIYNRGTADKLANGINPCCDPCVNYCDPCGNDCSDLYTYKKENIVEKNEPDVIISSVKTPLKSCKAKGLVDKTTFLNTAPVNRVVNPTLNPTVNRVVNPTLNPTVNRVVNPTLNRVVDDTRPLPVRSVAACGVPYSNTLPPVVNGGVAYQQSFDRPLDYQQRATLNQFDNGLRVTPQTLNYTVRDNVGAVTNTGLPYTVANNLNQPYTQASINGAINGVDNLRFCGNNILYEPLIAGVPQYEFPSFTVVAVPLVGGRNCSPVERLAVTFVYYPADGIISTARTVTISVEKFFRFFNNIWDALESLRIENKVAYTYQVNNLLLYSTYVPDGLPTESQIFQAFIVWVYSYIGFVGGTRWEIIVGTTTTNIPWIPVYGNDLAIWDNVNYNIYSSLYVDSFLDNADYLFEPNFLLYADVALQAAYMVVDEKFRRWCSVAAGGWYPLMFRDDEVDVQTDWTFRHFYIIVSLLCQKSWALQDEIKEMKANELGLDARVKCLEKKLKELAIMTLGK